MYILISGKITDKRRNLLAEFNLINKTVGQTQDEICTDTDYFMVDSTTNDTLKENMSGKETLSYEEKKCVEIDNFTKVQNNNLSVHCDTQRNYTQCAPLYYYYPQMIYPTLFYCVRCNQFSNTNS